MQELLKRLFRKPGLAAEILIATFFINLLFLASSIYVIQILGRYIPYGFDGTLITLTVGMVLTTVLLFFFQIIRNKLASAVSIAADKEIEERVVNVLTLGRTQALSSLPDAVINELVALPKSIQAAFTAPRINAVADVPFCFLFLLATYLLSPILALITLLILFCSMITSWVSMRRARVNAFKMQREKSVHRQFVSSLIAGTEMIRAFRAISFVKEVWNRQLQIFGVLHKQTGEQQAMSSSLLQGINGILRIGIYAVGAKLVVTGDMTVGTLIGANILSAKALQISSAFMQTFLVLGKTKQDIARLNKFLNLPMEATSGAALSRYSGRLQLKDVGIMHPGAASPLFESMHLDIAPGTVLGLAGYNGAGKSTFCKICVGLLQPSRGAVLVDGIDLRQIAPDWWRKQVCYVPQEPLFLSTTIRQNIIMAAPEIDDTRLNEVIRSAGLRRFLDTSKDGLETMMAEGGRDLPHGIRRKIALARALVVDGPLVILDEPTEGLDAEGRKAVYEIMNTMHKAGKTIIVVTQDPNIAKGVSLLCDFSVKPVPSIKQMRAMASPNEKRKISK